MFTEIGGGVVTCVVWAIVSVILLSFIEYFVHRAFLHRGILPSVLCKWLPSVDEYSRAHAVLHHTRYYRLFNFEPDPIGREIDLRLGLYTAIRLYAIASPLVLLLVLIAPAGAVIFSILAFAHMYLWGLLHHEMHVPSNIFINGLAPYRFLARHHFLHHRYRRYNYNVIIPLADVLMGTSAQPKQCDIREMLHLGYLRPRHSRTINPPTRWVKRTELPARDEGYGDPVRTRRIMSRPS